MHRDRLPESLVQPVPKRGPPVPEQHDTILPVLIAILWLEAGTAVALSSMLALLVIGLRLGFPDSLRGLRRSVSTGDWAEIAYPLAATASLSIGWGLLGDRWLAFLPIAFMAWGDSVAGLVRAAVRRGRIAV